MTCTESSNQTENLGSGLGLTVLGILVLAPILLVVGTCELIEAFSDDESSPEVL